MAPTHDLDDVTTLPTEDVAESGPATAPPPSGPAAQCRTVDLLGGRPPGGCDREQYDWSCLHPAGFAVVGSNGVAVRSSAGTKASHVSTGRYEIIASQS